eukprot:gene379-445_t
MATRPWSLTVAVAACLVGTALGYRISHEFDRINFIACMLGSMAAQIIANLINSYYDMQAGVDTAETSGDRTMFDFGLSKKAIMRMISFFLLLGLAMLSLLYVRLSLFVFIEQLLPLVLIATLLGIYYTAGPYPLKYYALGDITIVIAFGPLLVQGSFIGQAHFSDSLIYLYSLPLAFTTEAVLHANNTRDISTDTKANITTVASILGFNKSYYAQIILYLL